MCLHYVGDCVAKINAKLEYDLHIHTMTGIMSYGSNGGEEHVVAYFPGTRAERQLEVPGGFECNP